MKCFVFHLNLGFDLDTLKVPHFVKESKILLELSKGLKKPGDKLLARTPIHSIFIAHTAEFKETTISVYLLMEIQNIIEQKP